MKQIKNSTVLIFMFFTSLINLLIVFLVKYDLNSISIRSFDITNVGILFPIALQAIFLIILFISLFIKTEYSSTTKALLFLMSIISLVLLVFGYLHHKFNLHFLDEYLFGYPGQRIITGISLSGGFFIQVYLSILLFNLLFTQNYISYVRSLLIAVLLLVIIFVSVFVFTTVQEFRVANVKPGSNNIAVVLGAAVWQYDQPSPIFKGRIEKANQLFRSKRIYKIQLCGGSAPGEVSEARAALEYAIKLGIRRHAILIEEETSTTAEQIKYIRTHLALNPNFNDIFIISDQFHLARVKEICKFFGVKAIGIQSDYNLNWEKLLYYRFRETVALINFWIFAL